MLSAALPLVAAVGWARSRSHCDSLRHVYTKVPGAVGHYRKVVGEDLTLWVAPAMRATEFESAGGHLIVEHPYVDGADPGWTWQSEPFVGFDRPLPTNRLGFATGGGDVILPYWAVVATAAVPGVVLVASGRRRRHRRFPVNRPEERRTTGERR